MYSVLKLIIKQETGMTLPIDKNGLGYNNLIFMSLLLSKMQADSDGKYMGSNAKVFPMLVIEEPEAHLHPTMQDKFINLQHSASVECFFLKRAENFINLWYNVLSDHYRKRVRMIEKQNQGFKEFQ